MTHTEAGVTLELVKGNIVKQGDLEAIVNAANAQLRTGGGVAGAIHSAAGPGLTRETRSMAPIEPGEAVISGAHDLPNDHVIHALGPVYGRDEPSDELLRNAYQNSLYRAEENEVTSVAFPALSTGAFGYPVDDAAHIALETVLDMAPDLESVRHVRFVLFGDEAFEAHRQALATLREAANA